ELSNYIANKVDAFTQEYRILTADSKVVWVDDRTSIDRDDNGDINYIQGTVLDISAHKNKEDEISRSEQHLKLLREQSPIASIEWDIDFQVVAWNQAAEQMFGYKLEEVKGQKAFELILPDDVVIDLLKEWNQLTRQKDGSKSINEYKTKDGNIILCEWHNSPLVDDSGSVIGLASLCIDITSQHKSHKEILEKEQELREILDSMIDAVLSIDQNGIITTFNKAAEQLFGYSKDEVIGEKVNCLMPEPHNSQHDDYLNRYVKTGKKHIIGKSVEIQAIHKNKGILPIRLSVAELPTDTTGSKRFIGTCQDIRIIKEQEELLRRSQKMDALGKLTGGIAHDYNNMLGVVLGYAEMLENKLQDQPHLAKYANQIYKAGERGAKLTKRLLSFSRHDSPTQANKVNINKLLKEQQDLLQKTLTVRIQLLLDLSEILWDVSIDQSEFEDAILNMSINAMHAMAEGGDLTISTRNKSLLPLDAIMLDLPTGDYVQLTIADTGCGIDDVTKNKLFDPFFSTKGNRGTGLGLSQVFGFVKRANGVIKVFSQLGKGSQFVLYFPRTDKDEKGSVSELEDASRDITGKENILIVDDEAILLNLLSAILKPQGYTVFSAESGELALELLKKEHIDLMISDVIMPKMDGYQLATIVQKKYPHIKIQLASGYSDERQKCKFDRYLYDNLLFKPYDTAALLKRIRLLLDDDYIQVQNEEQQPILTSPIEWSDKLSIGIPEIDSDHKVLLSLLNRCIIFTNEANKDHDDCTVILHDLVSYTQYHFQREEKVMELCDYPDTAKHCQAHIALLNDVKELQKQLNSDEDIMESLLQFLMNWLLNHIVGMDSTLATYCKGQEEQIAEALKDYGGMVR
ncbi:MAG: bacteriohemerythrin, partial [Gammaproteobacteria bacterium]|nr:bacteriohemerythrin [Gammaproteobacteria bacterium]